MPKLRCKCGNVINLSPIPCPDGYALISEEDMDAVYCALDTAPSTVEDLLENATTGVLLCRACGRYYISCGKESSKYNVFSPESPAEE